MTCETGKEAWDKLKELYKGKARIKRMQVLNLKRDFETLAMKEKDTIQDYYDNLMGVFNKMRLMGEDVSDSKIVEKLFVSLPERFESKFSSLEDSKDISELSLSELINSLQAQEQRRAMRNKEMRLKELFWQKLKSKNLFNVVIVRRMGTKKKIVGTRKGLDALNARDLDMCKNIVETRRKKVSIRHKYLMKNYFDIGEKCSNVYVARYKGKGRLTGFQKSGWVDVEVFVLGEKVQFFLGIDL
ncbi:hypothetical protein AgCh_001014 [Apium graveolens]